jgi:hypothetical protein
MKPLITCAAIASFLCPTLERAYTASDPAPDSTFIQAMTQSMEKMDNGMINAPMNGDADHDMPSMMIPHHQGAIDMARSYLLHGKDPCIATIGAGNHRHADARDRRDATAVSGPGGRPDE